ncbi:MAG: hypothetical protein GKR94_01810 [Gammaproteobacteria bacterium]|nr:hypothetical protein [Gammaproteobacteria bacterium]
MTTPYRRAAADSQKALLIGTIISVLVVELLNSAVGAIIDRVSPKYHELSKRAKDMASAAVLLALCNCVISWALVLADTYL